MQLHIKMINSRLQENSNFAISSIVSIQWSRYKDSLNSIFNLFAERQIDIE